MYDNFEYILNEGLVCIIHSNCFIQKLSFEHFERTNLKIKELKDL